MRIDRWIRAASLVLLTMCAARGARAGGPLLFSSDGTPVGWNTAAPVHYYTDQGSLGLLSNSAVLAEVDQYFDAWENLPTAQIAFQRMGNLSVDVNETNFGPYLGPFGGSNTPLGQNAIVFDADGKIFDLLYGVGTGVVGFAAATFVSDGGDTLVAESPVPPGSHVIEGLAFFNGKLYDGIDDPPNRNFELPLSLYEVVFVHEFGHFAGLDHTQIHGIQGPPESDVPTTHPIETMFPYLMEDQQRSLERDDVVALSALYPSPGFLATTGRIYGWVFASDGTPLSGINVVARNVADDAEAVSAVSGATLVPPGAYLLPGLTPGASYKIEIQEVDVFHQGGSRVGPFSPPRLLPGEPEFYNGSNETENDKASDFTPVSVVAGTTEFGINFRVNRQPFEIRNDVLPATGMLRLALGDFDGDGRLDVAGTNQGPPTNQVVLLRGLAPGTFSAPTVVEAFPGNQPIVTGQFNSGVDSYLDLAVASVTLNEIRLYFGNGDGTFAPPVTLIDSDNANRLVALERGTLNGDAFDDLIALVVLANGDAIAYSLLGSASGTFQTKLLFMPPNVCPEVNVIAAQMSGDTNTDVVGFVSPSGGPTLSILAADGTGSFNLSLQSLASLTGGAGPLAAGDFNQDGFTDLAFSNSSPNGGPINFTRSAVDFLSGSNTGNFTFSNRYFVPESFLSKLVAVDLDRDGRLDVASAGAFFGRGAPGAEVTIAFGDGLGSVRTVKSIWGLTEFPGSDMAAGDLDADGWTDLLVNKGNAFLLPNEVHGASALLNRLSSVVAAETALPAGIRLLPVSPNPVSNGATISYELPTAGRARLDVYDAAGRHVRRLVDHEEEPGIHAVAFDGTDRSGRRLMAGIYVIRLSMEGGVRTGKLVLLH